MSFFIEDFIESGITDCGEFVRDFTTTESVLQLQL